MKTVRIRYTSPLALRQDVQRIFPKWGRKEDGTFDISLAKDDITDHLNKRHAFVKVVRDVVTDPKTGNVIGNTFKHIDIYALVRDTFTPPTWLQGVVVPHTELDPFTHRFMGHEERIYDAPSETPEEPIG